MGSYEARPQQQNVADGDAPDVSVVIPVFNEIGHLAPEVERIRASLSESDYSYEIIVVDDGSNDGSGQELARIPGIRLLSFAENRGTGSARRAGTLAARGSVIVWTDADMTLPNDRIAWFVRQLHGRDQIVGARRTEEGTAKVLRRPTKWLIRRLASYLMRTPIPDLNCGFRAFRRDVGLQFVHMLPKGFSCTSTMTMAFLANGYTVGYVPIDYARRELGKSKFRWWGGTKDYLTQVVRMVLSYEPLRVFGPLGVFLLVLGLAKLGLDWASTDFHLAANTLLILFAALLTLVIGFLADLIVRLTKPRNPVQPASR